MILDTSAIVAMLLDESGAQTLQRRLIDAVSIGVGAPTLVETAIVLAARGVGREELWDFCRECDAITIPFGEDHARVAMLAHARYGRGNHEARLNLGDYHTYATAKIADRPLLCTGEDFAKTDLEIA